MCDCVGLASGGADCIGTAAGADRRQAGYGAAGSSAYSARNRVAPTCCALQPAVVPVAAKQLIAAVAADRDCGMTPNQLRDEIGRDHRRFGVGLVVLPREF